MASGDSVVQVLKAMPAGGSAATIDMRAGGSTPAESIQVWDFDASATEVMDWLCKLEGYGGNGLTFTTPWMASSATNGTARLGLAIRRLNAESEDVDTAHTYVYNQTDDKAPSTNGQVAYPTITFSNGADMDSWTEGELAIVRFRRSVGTSSPDDMTGDLELIDILGLET